MKRAFLFILCIYLPLAGQIVMPPTDYPLRFSTDFLKQNTTWNWSGLIEARNTTLTGLTWSVSEQFNSNLILPRAESKQWKDEHRLNADFTLPTPYSGWRNGMRISSWMQNNRQSGPNNNFANHGAVFFSHIAPLTGLTLEPYAGYQQARNIRKVDWGWDVGMEGQWEDFRLDEYGGDISAASHYDFYDQRQNYNNRAAIYLGTQFSDFTSDSLRVHYEESIKQSYDSEGRDLLEVRLYDRGLENRLAYDISRRNRLRLDTKISSKNVSYFTSRDVFFIENRVGYTHIGQRLNLNTTFRTSDETLDNTGLSTDSRTRQSALSFSFGYFFNENYLLSADIDYVKLQHDTPDENNKDDRDEQRFIFNLSLRQVFSPLFYVEWRMYGYLFHQIYLASERSANNNWNRVIKIAPVAYYRHGKISNRLSAQVIANYTVYDFDNISTIKRSFIVRRFSLGDSLSYELPNGFETGFKGRVELEEKGSFFKEKFAQNLIQTLHTYYLNVFIGKNLFRRANLTAGFSFYERNEWRHIPEKRKSRVLQNRGPFVSFNYRVAERLTLAAQASVNYLKDSRQDNFSYNSGYLKLLYTF